MNSSIKEHIRDHIAPNSIIVEIGAHYGEDTVDFLKILNPSHIYCFEPDLRNTLIFKRYVKDSRAQLFECAVSNKNNEQVDFHPGFSPKINPKIFKKYSWISKEEYIRLKLHASGASSLKTGDPLVGNLETIKVSTIRLDIWMWENHINYIDFLWIDVQGAEREVLDGFGDCSSSIGGIWIEYGETAYEGAMDREETISVLSRMHFEVDGEWSEKGPKGNLLFWRCK